MPPTLWIDADACPRDAKDLVYRAADRLQFKTIFVANSGLNLPRSPYLSTVQVGAGLNVADAYMAKAAQPGDVAVTADIPLAAELVRKGVEVMDVRGELHTRDSVEERLAMRDLMTELRESGISTGGPAAYDQKAKQRFANTLDKVLNAAKKAAK